MRKAVLALAGAISRLLPGSFKSLLYRLGPISKAVRVLLNKAAPKGLVEVEISSGPLIGALMQLDLQREKDYWLGSYELKLQKALADHIVPGMVIYDVGANVGYISLIAARLAGEEGRVFAFEALPVNLERLRRNAELNPTFAPISVIPKAVAKQSREASFLIHNSGAMGKLQGAAGRDAQYSEEIKIEAISLDDFVFVEGEHAPDLIKIDIEGGEGLALEGMEGLLSKYRPLLFLELHGPQVAKSVLQTLSKHNYILQRLKRGYPVVASFKNLEWKSYLMAKPAK